MSEIQVWAPNAERVRVEIDGQLASMHAGPGGWWRGPDAPPGAEYAFMLDDSNELLPDPASRWQPEGVHGPSRVYAPDAYRWADARWGGRGLDDTAVIYELHVGTFTPGATLDSAIERLDHLVALGITHVELLPLNAFNGVWNWGYDGVCWYAVHEPYGGPDALKRFVDACHVRGLAVVLDVVYNHLGPAGNYLPRFGPYLTSGRSTWGQLINLAEPEVRRFIVSNALMWLRDFHIDALRLDAVHALRDDGPIHILAELSAAVHDLSRTLGRPLSLIAESDLNDPAMITPRPPGYGMDAQWDDDVHHALHSALTGEVQGYYCDFGPMHVLAKVLTAAFWHDGTFSTFRGLVHGKPVDRARTPGWRFVVCLQDHDQVGNRAAGERLSELTSAGLLHAGVVLLLTSPYTPMLWMGEEWAASTRWPFFTSHPQPELAVATGSGRIEEFAEHGWDTTRMIDPQDPAAYLSAILNWAEPAEPEHADVLALYRSLLALRAREPDLRDPDLTRVRVRYDDGERWIAVERGRFVVVANLSGSARTVPAPVSATVLATDSVTVGTDTVTLAPESAAIFAR